MTKFFSIAIDGPAGSGKSTIAKLVANKINFEYINTGAIFRFIAYIFVLNNWDINKIDIDKIDFFLNNNNYKIDGDQITLNNTDISCYLYKNKTSLIASKIALNPDIRNFIKELERSFAANKNVVMDGRDIGSVILPDAFLKIYLDASIDVRTNRRFKQLIENNPNHKIDINVIKNEIETRDNNDKNRPIAPLKICDDAIYIDGSNLSIDQVVQMIIELFKNKLGIFKI